MGSKVVIRWSMSKWASEQVNMIESEEVNMMESGQEDMWANLSLCEQLPQLKISTVWPQTLLILLKNPEKFPNLSENFDWIKKFNR